MTKLDDKKAELEHMEDRTQWRAEDQKRVESLRDEVESLEKQRPITEEEKEENRVKHQH